MVAAVESEAAKLAILWFARSAGELVWPGDAAEVELAAELAVAVELRLASRLEAAAELKLAVRLAVSVEARLAVRLGVPVELILASV